MSGADRAASVFKKLVASSWLFPVALFVLLIILSAFRISGSSVGSYHQLLYGQHSNDPNLLYGRPKMIRSDEWLVNTAFTVSQSHFDFPKVNPAIGAGFDTTVILDVPNRDWSELFRPQNWSFFVLPLEQAFAFKWWFIAYLFIVSVYFVTLTFLPKRRLLASLLALSLFFAPFIQWWYQTMTLAPVYYCGFAIIAFVHLLNAKSVRQKAALAAALAYTLVAFALIFYPPFQIPCAMAAAAVCVGYWLSQRGRHSWWKHVCKLLPVFGAIAGAGAVVVAYLVTRTDTISAIINTVYPGHRVVESGGYQLAHFLDGSLSYMLQSLAHAAHYIENQSEASNFIYLWPYLLIPSLVMIWRQWRRTHKLDFVALLVNALLLLLVARLFLPLPSLISKGLLLSSIPHNRLLIGFGFLGMLQLILVIRQLQQEDFGHRWAVLVGLLAVVAQLLVGYAIRAKYPLYLSRSSLIMLAAVAVGAMVYLVLARRPVMAAGLLLLTTLSTTFYINPLYVGLGELTHSKLNEAASKEPGAHSEGWVYLGSITIINLLQAGGLKSYSATLPYPQLAYDAKIDPAGTYKNVYNRYGFAMYAVDDPKVHGFTLNGGDSYFVDYQPCAPVFKQYIRHIVSQSPLMKDCLVLDQSVSYPNQFYYVYRVQ